MADPRERAELIRDEILTRWPMSGAKVIDLGEMRLVLDEKPILVTNRGGQVTGIYQRTRVFRGDIEIPIDHGRRVVNPPTLVPDGSFRREPHPLIEGGTLRLPNYRHSPEEALARVILDSIRIAPNPGRFGLRGGTVTTIFSGTGDGYLSTDTGAGGTYTSARNGTGLAANTTLTTFYCGQEEAPGTTNRFRCFEIFFAFDCSSLPDTDVISDAVISLVGVDNQSATDFITEIYEQPFGTLTTADYQTGDAYVSLTPLATFDSVNYAASYRDFTTDAGLLSAIDPTATLELIGISKNQVDNVAPSTDTREYIGWASADTSGTTSDPKITITHAAPPAFTPRLALLGVG